MQEEIWKSITGYDGLYEVSNLGRIKSLAHRTYCIRRSGGYYANFPEKIIRQNLTSDGYRVGLTDENKERKWYFVNRLVALEFIPNPNNYPIVLHRYSINDNSIDNLYWGNDFILKKKLKKKIKCVETDEIFESGIDIQNKLGFKATNIYQVCKGKHKQAYGYHWEYVD